jgi:hypothetical protein
MATVRNDRSCRGILNGRAQFKIKPLFSLRANVPNASNPTAGGLPITNDMGRTEENGGGNRLFSPFYWLVRLERLGCVKGLRDRAPSVQAGGTTNRELSSGLCNLCPAVSRTAVTAKRRTLSPPPQRTKTNRRSLRAGPELSSVLYGVPLGAAAFAVHLGRSYIPSKLRKHQLPVALGTNRMVAMPCLRTT